MHEARLEKSFEAIVMKTRLLHVVNFLNSPILPVSGISICHFNNG